MEWTKEQREQAQHEIALMELRHKPTFNLFEHEGVIDLQMQLTDALDENKRLRSQLKSDDTQMGELAVGGADELYELVHSAKHILEDVEMGIDRTPQVTEWLDRQRNIPAPPSGEQATPVDKTRCPYCGWPDEPKNEADNRCGGCGWPVKDMPAGFHAMDCPAAAPVEDQSPKGEV